MIECFRSFNGKHFWLHISPAVLDHSEDRIKRCDHCGKKRNFGPLHPLKTREFREMLGEGPWSLTLHTRLQRVIRYVERYYVRKGGGS